MKKTRAILGISLTQAVNCITQKTTRSSAFVWDIDRKNKSVTWTNDGNSADVNLNQGTVSVGDNVGSATTENVSRKRVAI